jgi:hypothetical protein
MNTRFGLLGLMAVVMMGGGFLSKAKAQIVVITDVQYTPPAGQNKAKANPKGTLSLAGNGDSYKVVVDYGTINGGIFTPDANVNAGGDTVAIISRRAANHNWTIVNGPHELTNPPAGLHVRARIQKWSALTTTWNDVAGAVAYAPCP